MNRKKQGFTIVELIITIIVIAVLAAVVIVSYRGITNNAATTKIKTSFYSIDQALEMFQLKNGHWPVCPATAPATAMNYSECLIKDIEPQLQVDKIPNRNDNYGSEINYVVMNNEGRWAARFRKPDNTFCKQGQKMYPTWWTSIPNCW